MSGKEVKDNMDNKDDFFSKEDLEAKALEALGTEGTPSEETPVEKIKLGEREFTQEEIDRRLSLSDIAIEAEEKWNTKIDTLFPAYSKSQNDKKELEAKIAEYESARAATVNAESTPDEITEGKKILKEKFGMVDMDEAKQIFNNLLSTDKATDKLLGKTRELETKLDGKDGRPSFNTQNVLAYMAEQGIKDPEIAYKLIHESEIDAWKETQLGKAKTPGLVTESSSTAGAKTPTIVKIDRNNLIEALKEVI